MKSHWIAFVTAVFCLLSVAPVAIAQGNRLPASDIPNLKKVSLQADMDRHLDIKMDLTPVSSQQRSLVGVLQFPDYIEIRIDGIHTSESLQEDINKQLLEILRQEEALRLGIPLRFDIQASADTFYLHMGMKEPAAYYITHDRHQLHMMTLPVASEQSSIVVGTQKQALTDILARLMMQQPVQFFIFAPQKDIGLWFANLPPWQVFEQLLQDYDIGQYQGDIQIYAPQAVLERFTPEFFQRTFAEDQISLAFANIPVKDMLQIISDFTNLIFITPQADLGNFSVQVIDMPWSQVLAYITTARGMVVKEIGQVSIIAAPDAITLANERGCFTSPAFEGFGLTPIELQHTTDAWDLIPQLEAQVQANYTVSPACEMLVLTPRMGGYGKTITVIASAADTQEIKRLIEQLDQPSSARKE